MRYRYTVAELGEVFEGTIQEASKHFRMATSTLRKKTRKGLFKRVLIDGKQGMDKRSVYRFEYQGISFEGTCGEARDFYGLTYKNWYHHWTNNHIQHELLGHLDDVGMMLRESAKDPISPPSVKRKLNKKYLLQDWIVNGGGN